MLSREAIQEQLTKAGCNFRFWGRSEINELDKILMEDEVISQCVNGEYSNGFALLVATNHRLLLVDKKPFLYLTVEDMRFDMITDFNYNHRMTTATICISTPTKSLTFVSWNKRGLRKLLDKLQLQVLEMRRHSNIAQYFNAYHQQQMGMGQSPVPQWQQPQQTWTQQPEPPRQVEPQSYYAQNLAPQPATEGASPAVTQAVNHASFAATSRAASRFAATRSALGTYTRNKLPSFHHRSEQPTPEDGEVYPKSYGANATSDYQIPYEY